MAVALLKVGLFIFLSCAHFHVNAGVAKSRDWGSRKGGKGFPSLGRGLGSGVLGSRGPRAERAVRQTWTYAICESGAKFVSNNKTINKNMTDKCAQCFLNITQDKMFSESGRRIAHNCSRSFLSSHYEKCNIMFGNSSAEDIMDCFQETFKRIEIAKCLGNATDDVDKYLEASMCIREKMRDFKKYVRLSMVDNLLGNSGCSFAAIVALKMFGKGMSGKGGDRLDSLIDKMVQDQDAEDFDKPSARPNYSTKPFYGKGGNGWKESPGNKGKGNKRSKGKGIRRSKRETENLEEDEYEEESGYESYMSDGLDEEFDEEEF